ncbi:hypothetical protein A9Q91_04415 [Candidatus Gracilibacteria bacterium 28_42_T64]|nr:hypothetical protein A9Q91_04415 [Candidatus Gracilibacteria bacterium 28_42_T64]
MQPEINSQEALAETYTLTAFFRSLIEYPYSREIIDYLLLKSGLEDQELQKRWDGFDAIFGEDYGKKISALSFSAIIEARGELIDSLLIEKVDKNTVILEVASGFSPRAINLINNHEISADQYIETDREEVTSLKEEFYLSMEGVNKPTLSNYNVVEDEIDQVVQLVLSCKERNPLLDKLLVMNEGLLIYLKPDQQKKYFDNLRNISTQLKDHGIRLEYVSIDMPTHENFTSWLVHEGFTYDDHIEVMRNVDSIILECLHDTEEDFFKNVGIDISSINKHYYSDEIIENCKTEVLEKYKNIMNLDIMIKRFLKQKSLYAYSINF